MDPIYEDGKYQIIKSWSGKVKTITSKDFVTTFGTGQFNIPEGATVFESNKADCCWSIGGAKYKKPGHWNSSNLLVRTDFKPIDGENFSLDGFHLYNHSVSETSSFPKLAFAAGIAVECTSERLLGFTVNGKNLDCPGRDLLLSNEIRIIETASKTTFRNRIIREPSRASRIDPGFTDEILQEGEIPPPMYGSTLTSLKESPIQVHPDTGALSGPSGQAVLACGGVLKNRSLSSFQLMIHHVSTGKEVSWQEESSTGVWVLDWNMNPLKFKWKRVLDVEARTFHCAVLLGSSLLLFGGTNLDTGERRPIKPVNIDTTTWEVVPLSSQVSMGDGTLVDLETYHISF